ncbi:hypothetical protein ABPG75_009191 [Micractinium tetrahymenae]
MAHISSVRLKAFKSVGSEWVEVPLRRGLCAIVGPNGCGKSSLLDAVLFAFAAPARSFGVASLSELASSDSTEVCEVSVQLRGRGGEAHNVAAALTPDGGRAFKVNGRNKTGREVRDFLRSLGASLEGGACVIRQARVTALADSAGPAELATLVAEASGLGRWNEEVAAATEEAKRTRKALGEVQAGLAMLERSVAADEAQMKAVERLEALEHEAAELAQHMAGLLQAALTKCQQEAAEGELAGQAARHAVAVAEQRVEECREGLEAARQALAAAQQQCQEEGGGGASKSGLLALRQRVAAAEEEVRLAEEAAQRRQQLAAQLEAAAAEVARLEAARTAAAAELAACQQAQRRVASDLQLADSAANAAALRVLLAVEERRLAAAVAAKQAAVGAAASQAEETAARLAELQAERQRLVDAQQAAGAGRHAVGTSLQQQQAVLRAREQQLQARLQAFRQQEQRLAAEAGTLAARLARAAGGSPATSGPNAAWRPLHQCFTFREPQSCAQYAGALAVLAGRKLGVLVADSLEAAGRLLASSAGGQGGGARIWPLDSLAAADYSERQRQAAAAFPTGQVVLPADLVAFAPAHRPAILRAFGSHVIAASDAVAEQLVTRFGIPSVTLSGRLTSRGTLQGGWRGDSGARQPGPLHLKLSLAASEQQLAGVTQEAAAAQAELDGVQHQLAEAAAQQEAAAAAAAELAATEREVAACQRALQSQQAAQADAQAALARLQAELTAKQQLLSGMGGEGQGQNRSCGSGSSGGAQAALQKEAERLATAAKGLEKAAHKAAAQLAAAVARQGQLEAEMAVMGEAGEEAERDARAELAEASAALAARQAELAVQLEAVAAHEAEVAQVAARLSAAEQAQAEAEGQVAALAEAAERRQGEQDELQQQLEGLVVEVPELAAVLGAGASSGQAGADADSSSQREAAGDSSVAGLCKSAATLGRQRTRLLEERRRSAAARLPLAELMRLREQQAALGAARQQAATLGTAVQRLQEGIAASSGQVLAAHEAVFRSIAATFASLTAAVLPAYRLRLRRLGREVHEGLVLEFAPHLAGASSSDGDAEEEEGERGGSDEEGGNHDSGSGGGGWRRGLDALSGGQRTMVSLALVVAAAMAGGGSCLLLMDEADAALDEANQQLVARLFDSLSRGGTDGKAPSAGAPGSGCTQVLAVSHSPTFQQLCRHVVRLTRGPKGTRLAEGGGGNGAMGVEQGVAAAAGGRTKKARKK